MEMFEEEINLREYWHVIYKRRWVVLTLLFIVTVSATIQTFRQTPVYEATARILIEKDTPKIVAFQDVLEMNTTQADYYQTQHKILKSRSLARQVLEKLGSLPLKAQQPQPPPVNSFSIRSLSDKVQTLLGLQHQQPQLSEAESLAQREERVISGFLNSVIVTPIRDSRLVDISARSTDRKRAVLVANTLIELYIDQNLDNKLATTRDAVTWLEKELETTQQKLVEAEAALHAYKEKYEIISIEDRENIVTQKLSELNTAVNNARIRRSELESQYRKIQEYSLVQLESLPQVMNSALIQQLKGELAAVESELADLQKQYRNKHPSVEAAQARVIAVRKRIQSETNRIIDGLEKEYRLALAREQDLSRMLDEQKQEVLDLNVRSIKYKELQREVESNQRIYDTLLQRTKETNISERLETNNIKIIDRAIMPMSPIAPNKKRQIMMGALMGLACGIALAFFFEYLDNSIKTVADLKQYLNIPFLGVVPKVSIKELAGHTAQYSAEKIVHLNPRSTAAEAYRSLRTNVTFALLNDHFLAANQGAVLLVTSTNPSEGKSSVAANLGIALAQGGSRTLIIDCDFRRPMMHRIFNLKHVELGFADMITNVKAFGAKKGIIQETGVENLHVIPCGKIPPNPSELLGSSLTRMIIGTLADKYDKILIDSPPVNTVTDPVVLSRVAHGVIFVLRAGETRRDVAQRAMEQLHSAEATILGGVLNSVDFEKDRYYYYSYSYSKYYRETDKTPVNQEIPTARKEKKAVAG